MPTSPFLLSLVIVAVGFVAGVIPFLFRWTHTTAHRWIALGGGTMLGAAFIHMLPEAYELASASSFTAALLGFLLLLGLEQLSLKHPHDEDSGEFHELGFIAFVGLTIHDVIDGLALGAGFESPQLTPAIFLALVLHKVPTAFSLSLLMLHGGYTRKRILAFLSLLLLAIPAGTLLSSTLIRSMGADHSLTIGRLIGFSAGTFVYIGAYELLPEMQRKSGKGSRIGLFFVIGIGIMFMLALIERVA